MFYFEWAEKKFKNEDIIQVWKLVDAYYEKWIEALTHIEVVSKRSWDDKNQITKSMKESIDDMIYYWNKFKRFQEIIKHKETKSQVILTKEFEITDEEDWQVHKIKIKWKPDFLNEELKLIVDLKTTESIDNMTKWLKFYNWNTNLNARYIRQLSIYNFMSWWDCNWALAILTPTGVRYIQIPNRILIQSWEYIKKDLLELHKFIITRQYNDDEYFRIEDISEEPKDLF
jgi:hypothetical protein